MAETAARPCATGLIPLAHVADVERSVEFYSQLGMDLRGHLKNAAGRLQWAHVGCEHADLMFSVASEAAGSTRHSVLFYLYSPDLVALRTHLLAHGVRVSGITYPAYMPKGEIRVDDPDGYCLLIGQAG